MGKLFRAAVLSLLLVAVAAGAWASWTYVRTTSHDERCRKYRNALTVAYADPQSTEAVRGLSVTDTGLVKSDRDAFRKAYASDYSAELKNQEMAAWHAYSDRQRTNRLADRGC